jgi:hypothetical protein
MLLLLLQQLLPLHHGVHAAAGQRYDASGQSAGCR